MACTGIAYRERNHSSNSNTNAMKANSSNSWETHMPRIRQLYMDEGKTLKEVMEIMKAEHGFTAS